MLNTLILVCIVITFALLAWMNPNKKFVMEHIQNATLAGGVAIGAVADLLVGPWAALTIGSMAGMICVFGFNCITVKQYSSPLTYAIIVSSKNIA